MVAALKPMKDAVFKVIFGSDSNKKLLKSLIESVVGRTIEHLEILNPYVDVQTIKDKKAILDVKVKALFQGNHETYNIEIQVNNQVDFHTRSLYYWAKAYGGQLQEGETYNKLNKHICINLLNFELFDHRKFHSTYMILEKTDKILLTDHLEMHFVQMQLSEYNKGIPSEEGTMLEKWVYFLVHGDQLSAQEASRMHPSIAHAHAHKDFHDLQQKKEFVEAISMREKDDLALVLQGKKLGYIEEIEEIAREVGLEIPDDQRNKFLKKDVESLRKFARGIAKAQSSEQLDSEKLRWEIQGFLD